MHQPMQGARRMVAETDEQPQRGVFIPVSTRYAAQKAAPWAAVIARCEGGYMAFESTDDYGIWCRRR